LVDIRLTEISRERLFYIKKNYRDRLTEKTDLIDFLYCAIIGLIGLIGLYQ